jgi:cysteine desulfurase/selenocysteine lyase
MSVSLTPSDLAREFPILGELAFFNHAGVAPISGRAAEAMRRYADQAATRAYVGSGWYRRAHEVKQLAAQLIHARGPHEIAFVGNTSHGLSLVAKGIDWQPGDNVVITNVEYPANRYPWIDLERLGVEVIEVLQLPDGRIDPEDVANAITNRTRVVSVSHVQYASGHRLDLRPISDMVHRVNGYLCVDAIQSVGALPVDVQAMGIDFLAADGHKWMLGPEGAGIFYCHEDLCPLLHPNVVGWMNMVDAQNYGDYRYEFQMDARRFEPGSYNIPGILGLGASLELLLEVGIDQVWSRIDALTTQLCDGLQAKGYLLFTPRDTSGDERSGILLWNPKPGQDPKRLVTDLDKQGIIIVVREGRLRASPHFYNTPEQIERLLDALP